MYVHRGYEGKGSQSGPTAPKTNPTGKENGRGYDKRSYNAGLILGVLYALIFLGPLALRGAQVDKYEESIRAKWQGMTDDEIQRSYETWFQNIAMRSLRRKAGEITEETVFHFPIVKFNESVPGKDITYIIYGKEDPKPIGFHDKYVPPPAE